MLRIVAVALFMALLTALWTPASAAMLFDVESSDPSCGPCTTVYATGVFDQNTATQFRALLDEHPFAPGTTIVFDSPGGSLFDAMEVGEIIRERRFHTSVFGRSADHSGGICASACSYAFLGGTRRTVGETARFGLHQFSGTPPRGDAVSQAQTVVSIVSTYVRLMGASQEIVEVASRIPPNEIEWLSVSDMRRMGVITSAGTRFSPAWTARRTRTVGGVLIEAQSLQADGATIDLTLTCKRWDRLFDREPPSYSLHVTLPDPPGGLPGLREYQLSPTEITDFAVYAVDGNTVLARIVPHYPWRVDGGLRLSFLVNLDARLVERVSEQGFVLQWNPAVTGRSQVNVPVDGFAQAFAELRGACEPLWRN